MEDKLIALIQLLKQGELEFIGAKSMEMLGHDASNGTGSPPTAGQPRLTSAARLVSQEL